MTAFPEPLLLNDLVLQTVHDAFERLDWATEAIRDFSPKEDL